MNPYESPEGLQEPGPFPLHWLAKEAWLWLCVTLITMVVCLLAALTWPISSSVLIYMALDDAFRTKSPLDCFLAIFLSLSGVLGTAVWTMIVSDLFF
jgi:hypothetical protein